MKNPDLSVKISTSETLDWENWEISARKLV